MDFGKMKVVELRAELQARGLDTRGVKAALIDRLKEALDAEEQQSGGEAPKAAISQAAPDTPRAMRRTSRSRTRSPEPVVVKVQDPQLQSVQEEQEESADKQPAEQDAEMYEKIIDEMDADQQQDDIDEDALLEDTDNHDQQKDQQPEQMETAEGDEKDKQTDEENRGVKRRSNSPAKGESPKKKQRLPPPNIDDFVNDEDEPELDENSIQLSWFDSDLNLKIDRESFSSAISLCDTGLALVWAGARANYGAISNGKYFFEVQLLANNSKISYPNEKNLHEIRCGWSTSNSSLQLGESEFSYGLDSSGRKCSNSEFSEYGVKLSVQDVIGVHLHLNDDKSTIQFTINGKDQGVAFEFDKSTLSDEALYPHISTKNVEYKVNFGQHEESMWSLRRDGHKECELARRRKDLEGKKKDLEKKREEKAEKLKKQKEAEAAKAEQAEKQEAAEEKPADDAEKPEKAEKPAEAEKSAEAEPAEPEADEPEPILPDDITEAEVDADTPHENCLNGYKYIVSYPIGELSKGPRRPDLRTDCEVIMMIGLPGAGKSHWAAERAKEFPERRYTMLGTKYLLERMKILGKPRKPNSGPGRWEKLIELCNRGLLTLNEIACKRRRNYILDQPHVYISDQRRKMRVYGDFKRIAAIVVGSEEEYKRRAKQRLETEGKDIPEAAVNEMRANITLPELEYMWFNEILYTDLEKEPAGEEVKKENERGKKALNNRNRQNNFNRRDFNNRNDRRWAGNQNRNDFRRNDRNWAPNQRQMGAGYRRDFDFNGGRGRNNWMGPESWMNRPRGYGGPPPPRPGGQKRPQDNRNQNRNDRNFRQGGQAGGQGQGQGQSQGGGNNNANRNNNNRNDRRQDGNKKFGGGKSEWTQGNPWGNNWGYGNQAWGNNWSQNQYGGSNSSADNSNDANQGWMAYYQQSQQQISQNWYNDSYGGAFSSNSNYDSNQTKQ